MIPRQDLNAYRLQKQEKQEAKERRLAEQRTIKHSALGMLGVAAALICGVGYALGYQDPLTYPDLLKRTTTQVTQTISQTTNSNYSIAQTTPKQKLPQEQPSSQRQSNSSLDKLLAITDDMSTEEVARIIEIENLRYETYLLSLNQLQETTPKDNRIKTTTLTGKFSKYKPYQRIIEEEVEKYNAKFHFPKTLTGNHIYAMIETESGKNPEAFRKDPMQIANQGDHALETLRTQGEYTWQIGDFSFLQEKEHTRIMHWLKLYNRSNMDAESSIKGGIGWLVNKAAIRNNCGNIVGWRSWNEAARRYNGGGDDNYKTKVIRNLNQLAKL